MKAGVSPQADDLRKLLKYMGGDYTTEWKRKMKKFDKKYGKKAEKTKKTTTTLPSDSSSSAPSSDSDSEPSTSPAPRKYGEPSSSCKKKRQYDEPSIQFAYGVQLANSTHKSFLLEYEVPPSFVSLYTHNTIAKVFSRIYISFIWSSLLPNRAPQLRRVSSFPNALRLFRQLCFCKYKYKN
jgi:hypothetical protein